VRCPEAVDSGTRTAPTAEWTSNAAVPMTSSGAAMVQQQSSWSQPACGWRARSLSPGWAVDRLPTTSNTRMNRISPAYSCTCIHSRILQDLQCESKNPPWGLLAIFPKRLEIFQPHFTRILRVPVYARLQIFIQLSATLTKLCHIKRDHPVHIMCAKCPQSAEAHAGIFWHFPQTVRNF